VRCARLAWLVVLAACPGIPQPIEAPQVSLRSATVAAAALEAELSVLNPNREGLVLEAVDWQLDVDDRPLARGRAELHVAIAAMAPALVSVRGTLSPGQEARLAEATRAGTPAVTLVGTLHLRAARGPVAATFYGPVAGAPLTSASAGVR